MMKNHQEIKEEIFRRSELYFKKRETTRKKVLYTSIPVCICLMITALVAVNNFDVFNGNYVENNKDSNISYEEITTTENYEFKDNVSDSDKDNACFKDGCGNYVSLDDIVSENTGNSNPSSEYATNTPAQPTTKYTSQADVANDSDDENFANNSSANQKAANGVTTDSSKNPQNPTVTTKPTKPTNPTTPNNPTSPTKPTQPTTTNAVKGYYHYIDDYVTTEGFFNEITYIYVKSGESEKKIYKSDKAELIREFCSCICGLLCIETEVEQDRIDNAVADTIIIKCKNGAERVYAYYRDYAMKDLCDSSSEYGVLTQSSIESLIDMLDKILMM